MAKIVYSQREGGEILLYDAINTIVIPIKDHKITCSDDMAATLVRLGHASYKPDPSRAASVRPSPQPAEEEVIKEEEVVEEEEEAKEEKKRKVTTAEAKNDNFS